MKFSLRNINVVSAADITLNGLTVIAGENSSGKSTVGKMLFSLIKSLSPIIRGKGDLRNARISRIAQGLYNRLCRLMIDAPEPINDLLPPSVAQFEAEVSNLPGDEDITAYFAPMLSAIDSGTATPREAALIRDDIDDLRAALAETDSRATDLQNRFGKYIRLEFQGNISSETGSLSSVALDMADGDSMVSISVSPEGISVPQFTGTGFPTDASYIESPLYLHIMDILTRIPGTESYDPDMPAPVTLPAHVSDMIDKIESMKYLFDSHNHKPSDSAAAIREIVGGEFFYDKNRRSVMFRQGDSEFYPINVASGIKSLGLLQILLDSRLISPNKLLIWDEPENHLHPLWQVKLAEITVKLAGFGIPILVSTHSPYFIQGVKYFAETTGCQSFVDYFLAETAGGVSTIQCVNDDLNRIFMKLAAPLHSIML